MTVEANKKIIAKLYQDLFVRWDLSLIEGLFSTSFDRVEPVPEVLLL